MKHNASIIAETIKSSLSARTVGEALGLKIDRHGRVPCPLHNGVDRNCKLYDDDRGFYCFRCNQGGDCIKLVECTLSLSFWQAVEWINTEFSMGLKIHEKTNKNEQAQMETKLLLEKSKREQMQKIEMLQFDLYCIVGVLLATLERDAEKYRPTKPSDEYDERFVNAVRTIPEVEETAEKLALEVIGKK